MDQNLKIRTAFVFADGIFPLSQKEGTASPVFSEKIGGLTLFERIAHVSGKAGVERLLVSGLGAPEIKELKKKVFGNLHIKFLEGSPKAMEKEAEGEPGYFFISGDCVFDPGALRELGQKTGLLDRFDAVAAISRAAVSVPCPGLFLGNRVFLDVVLKMRESGGEGWTDVLRKLCEAEKLGYHDLGDNLLCHAGTKKALKEAEKRLYKSLVKKTDGFLASHINRRISLFITRFLVNTALTPNHITLMNLAIGLIGALFFAIGGYGPSLAGALVFQFSSITDGCDGEIARLKFMESRFGGWLDIFCDNLTHLAVFGGIAFGAYRVEPAFYLIYCGWLAVFGTLMSFLLVAFQLYRKESTKGPLFVSVMEDRAGMSKGAENILNLQDSLARRDFTYLLLIFALSGYSKYFLALTAIGSNIFWLLLVFPMINRRPATGNW
jgi:phosphatidylglycerophosphate synthase